MTDPFGQELQRKQAKNRELAIAILEYLKISTFHNIRIHGIE